MNPNLDESLDDVAYHRERNRILRKAMRRRGWACASSVCSARKARCRCT